MLKFWIPGFTTAMAVSLAAFWPQEGEPKQDVNVVTKAAGDEGPSSADALRDIYARLRRIRSERLAERPRALSDDAARLYRQALKATDAKEFDKAKALTMAARELVRALELAQSAQRDEPADPDLPPPPGPREIKVFTFSTEDKLAELPPPLPTDGRKTPMILLDKRAEAGGLTIHGDVKVNKLADEGAVMIGGDRVRLVKPDGVQQKRDVIVEKLGDRPKRIEVRIREDMDTLQKQQETARQEAVRARDEVVNARVKMLDDLKIDLKQLEKSDRKIEIQIPSGELEALKHAEAAAKLHESIAGETLEFRVAPQMLERLRIYEKSAAGRDGAVAELKSAYETILKARKAKDADASRTYLDAARDLYNAARREAEAGHFDRSSELSHAARLLTQVPKHLESLKPAKPLEGLRGDVHLFQRGGADGNVQLRFETSKPVEQDSSKQKPAEVQIFQHEKKEGEPQIHLQSGKRADEKGEQKRQIEIRVAGPGHEESDPHTAPTQGIGVMIDFADGIANVTDLVPNGPAADDGRIKKGDAIVGIETEKGATIGFGDKSMEDAVKVLRGPIGSKVKVIVRPSGTTDRKVYELERKKLEVPGTLESRPAAPAGEEGASLPPKID